MNSSEEYIQLLKDCLPKLKKDFGVLGLAIFGSVARGENNGDSDIDILVDMPPKILLMSALKIYLEQTLNTSVDLIRRHSHLSHSFQAQISKDAITIF